MSIADLLKQHFLEGGPFFMILNYTMWIMVVIFVIRFVRNYKSEDKDLQKLSKFNSTIIFIGGFGLLLSIFFQHAGIYGALSIAEKAQDISPNLLLGGLRVSLIAPLYSFFLFLVSGLIWYIFRNLIKA